MSFENEIRDRLVNLEAGRVNELVKHALASGAKPFDILGALRKGMEIIGEKFERSEYFVSELIFAAEIMKSALEVLKPHLKAEEGVIRGKVVLGTIIGDLHDIGKEIIRSLLVSAGFEVYDLGIDVPPEEFVKKAKEVGADIIGVSALLSTSAPRTAKVVEELKKVGLRERFKVIIGGAAVRPWMIEKYEVDSAVCDAIEGLNMIKSWVVGTE